MALSTDSPVFYENCFNLIHSMKNDSYIICGDFNLVVDPNLYHNYKHIANPKARQFILNSIEDRQLSDPYRELFPSQKDTLGGEQIQYSNLDLTSFLQLQILLTLLKMWRFVIILIQIIRLSRLT